MKMPTLSSKKDETNSNKTALPLPTVSSKAAAKEPTAAVKPLPSISNTDNWQRLTAAQQARQQADAAVKHTASVAAREFPAINDQNVEDYEQWVYGQMVKNNWTDEQLAAALGSRKRQSATNLALQAVSNSQPSVQAVPISKEMLTLPSVTRIKGRDGTADTPTAYIQSVFDRLAEKKTAEENKRGFLPRLADTVKGGAKSSLASNVNAIANAYDLSTGSEMDQYVRERESAAVESYQRQAERFAAEYREMLEDNRRTPGKWSDAVLENQRTKAENAAKATGVLLELKGSDYRRGAADAVYELADTIQQSSAEDIERAKKGLGTFGEMVVDAGASMTQVGLDALANTATGGQTMIPFALRAYGGGAQQARQNGAGLKGASLYGAASAAKEIFTEKMFNIAMPFAKAYGGGTWDDAVETAIGKAVDKLAKTEAGSRLLGGALTLGAGAISEGLEELIGDWLEWQMPRIYGGDVDSAAETLSQSLYDFAVGTLSGAMGGVADGGTYNYGAPKYLKGPADFADTGAAESQTGNLTPATNRAAETQKNSALEERTEVNDDPAQHSVAEQSVIEEYKSAVNQRLLTWVDRVRAAFASGDSSASKMRLLLGEVKPNTAQAIQAVSGIDVNGFRHMIDGAAVQHDERRHGAHGTADHSMENAEDVARIEYVLDNFDAYDLVRWPDGSPRLSGQYRDKNNRPAPLVMFQKKVDGTYYAVEAVPDSADRKLHIVSAYMNKASESIIQELNMRDQSPPQLTPETPLGPIASAQANFIIQQKSNAVKSAVEEMKIFPSTAPAESGVKRFSAYGTTDAARQAQFQRAEQIAEKFGARFQVAELASGVDGEYQNGIITISPNVQNPVTAVLVHELTHHMESSGRYGEFSKMVLNHIAREYDVGVDELKKEIRARYAEAGIQLDDTGAEREIVARFAQENLFQNEETINHLARENHSLAQMIRDWLADLAVKLKGTEEERFVRNAERLYEKALRGVVGNSDMTQGEYLYVRPSRSAIAVAEAQETIGLADEAIRRDTGLHRSMDGQWRAEIDDSNARYLDSDLRGRTLGEVLDHEELYRIYPWLRDIEVEHTMFGTSAYDPATDRIILNDMQIAGASKSEKRALVLHEVQHAIQEHEGFARGSSEGYWRALRAEGVLPEELKNQSDRDLYLRTAGEIEARDAANRASMDEATRYLTAPDLGDGRALNEPRYLPAPSLGDGKYSLGRGIDDLTAHYLAAPNLNGMALEDGTRVSPEIAEALERMQNRTQPVTDNPAMGKADFTGTRALQKLGVKIANSVGLYQNLEQLKGQDRAAKQVAKERRRAESRLDATKAERTFARGIMDGLYTEADIPASMDRAKVTELADYYRAEQQTSDDRIKGVRRTINRELEGAMAHLFRDSDRFKPESGFVMSYRTPQRIMNAIFGETRAKAINEAIFNPVAENEAERIRFINRMFDEVRTFQGKDGKASELTTEESALVQQVIEGKAAAEEVAGIEMRSAIESAAQNLRSGEDIGDVSREFSLSADERALAQRYARWLETESTIESGNVDSVKIENAVNKYSQMFDDFYDAINDFLVAHGYEPIGFIKGYAPHIQSEENQSLLNKAFKAMGINTDVSNLPTSIAGQTGYYKPNKRWNPFFLHRTADTTAYDIVSAYESYVDYMSDILYHTDDIMRVRQAANYFRKTYAPDEIKNTLEWASELKYGSAEQKAEFLREQGVLTGDSELNYRDVSDRMDEYVDEMFRNIEKTTKYSDLVMWLDNYANLLAGKQNMADRGSEIKGRTLLNLGNKLQRAFARTQIAANVSSMLNQTAQMPQIRAELGAKYTAKAIRDIFNGEARKGSWVESSDFLTEKEGINYLAQTPGEKIISGMFWGAGFTDEMVSTVAVRGKYLKEIDAGKGHAEAMKAADKFGKEIMGSRAKGSIPTAFTEKNIISQMVNVFQVEALNSWEHISQDLPREFRETARTEGMVKASRDLAGVLTKTLISTFILNRIAEGVYGGTPAPFDILGLAANFIASGEELPTNDYLLRMLNKGWAAIFGEALFDDDDEEDKPFNWKQAIDDTAYNISNDIPFVRNISGVLGLGDNTLPLPNLYGGVTDVGKAIDSHGIASGEAVKAVGSLAAELVPGGKQAKKLGLGAEALIRGGDFSGYGENERLKYPIEATPANIIKALLFGKYSTSASNRYYAAEESALSANQTKLWREMVNGGADSRDVYDTIQTYRKIGSDDKLTAFEQGILQRELLREMAVSDRQKLDMYRGLNSTAASRAEKFEAMMEAGMDFGTVMDVYDGYAFYNNNDTLTAAQKATEFARWVDESGLTEKQTELVKDQLKYYLSVPAKAKTQKDTPIIEEPKHLPALEAGQPQIELPILPLPKIELSALTLPRR